MAAFESPWPQQIVERGGLSYEQALRRLGWSRGAIAREPASPPEVRLYRASMRVTTTVVVITLVGVVARLVRRLLRRKRSHIPQLRCDLAAAQAIEATRRLLPGARAERGDATNVGCLLLVLASTPGHHLRLLDNATVLACAVRRDLGLAAWHHRLILALDRPNLETRQMRLRLQRRVARHGRASRWGPALLCFRFAGLLFAVALFPVTVLATVLLYTFLWPATILMAGLRALAGMIVGCDARGRRWHEIPGGETSLFGDEPRISAARLAVVVLLPRVLAFACSFAALLVLVWRSQRLGVALFPTLFSRPDVRVGASADALFETPLIIFADAWTQNGLLGGIGLLAGLGLAVMSLPTYRELQLIRLHAGHELGEGSRLARIVTLPATILTGAFACVETVLPLRNGPLYLTVYIVPLLLSLALAAYATALLPY